MNNNQDVVVSFEGVPSADQNTLAQELSEKLLTEARRQTDVNPQAIRAEVHKADANTMDLGNLIDITLIIEHLPPAIVAHLIYEFFLRHGFRFTGKLVITIVCRVRGHSFKLDNTQDEPKLLEFLKQCLKKDEV